MSNILASTYDNIQAVTKSDSVADPQGPYAGLLVSVAGTLKITAVGGGVVALVVVAGQIVPVATKMVWSTGTAATVFGLTAIPYKPAVSS